MDWLRHLWDKLGGNFRTVREEVGMWRMCAHARHWSRVKRQKVWFRGPDDDDARLHALKNYWSEFVRACPRTVADGVLVCGVLGLLAFFL